MPDPRRRLVALAVAFLLASPASALAQSAGDEQYDDPFGGGGGGGQQEQPASTPEPAPAPAEPAPAPAATAEPTTSEPAPAAPAAESSSTGGKGKQLPRTGAPTGLVIAAGVAMLLGGLLLRRSTTGERH
jgi:LPXTG-motif cell wall-anchored protein